MNTEDRRTPGTARVAYDGVVEVGGTLGPSFEAHAVDVSEEGMHLRSAYLPELGQQITCRFEAEPNRSVVGSGEVIWAQGAETGGEFGIRFTEMDAECVEALKRVCGMQTSPALVPKGGKVRLYIEGLASPMRAKIRESVSGGLTVGSDLGFLQVGKRLELEDTLTGGKRPATIHRVDVDVDASSRVPQLVVTLRYVDRPVSSGAAGPSAEPEAAVGSHAEDAAVRMRGALAEQAARVGPAMDRVMRRMKTTIGLLARGRGTDDDPVPRRTTAPAPGGGLRTEGRRVVRGETAFAAEESTPGVQAKAGSVGRRKVAIGAAIMATAVLGAFALKHSHQETSSVVTPAPGASEAPAVAGSTAPPAQDPAAVAPPAAPPAVVATPPAPAPATAPLAGASGTAGEEKPRASSDGDDAAKKHPRPQPFANGPVHHGNILRLKMDGPVEAIQGAQEPTGFLIKIPGRRSLEPASPLAARDGRIQTIKVTNGSGGAELSVTFKDSVPNYRVSARGDSLVIALAPVGSLKDTTLADSAVGKRTSRSRGGHTAHTAHTNAAPPEGAER